jgi:aspartyl-tRNA(Asn)/glutamyl-tRNA(Gln) amidotransferase subunit A
MELTTLTITEAADLIAARRLSPVELTQAHLERMDKLAGLNCYITTLADAALQTAREAEAAIQRGEYRGVLHGIPVALKDLYETGGVRTTAGSKFLRDYVPAQDSTAAAKLSAAGTILLGKLNMHEWAFGPLNTNPHYGACRNPWDTTRIPGGSSGGSGAALAAGLCMGSLGSDTRGSIRIPAALCGVVGLKPTYGRVSLRGVLPLSWSLDHAGPMARRVRDVAVLLQAIAGYDPQDALSVDMPVDDYLRDIDGGVNGWKIALAVEGFDDAEPEILRALEQAVNVFQGLGAQVTRVNLADLLVSRQSSGVIAGSDAAAFHQERIEKQPEDFGADVLSRLKKGTALSGVEYANARLAQATIRHRLTRLFDDYEVLLAPTLPIGATRIDDEDGLENARQPLTYYNAPFNMAGIPALALPCGFTSSGMPIGLQIAGRLWAEGQVLRAGSSYERATDWHLRQPDL